MPKTGKPKPAPRTGSRLLKDPDQPTKPFRPRRRRPRKRGKAEFLLDTTLLAKLADRDFSKPGDFGKVPKEYDDLALTAVSGRPPRVFDLSTGRVVVPGRIQGPCPGRYFVALIEETPGQPARCRGTVWRTLVRKAERRALRTVRRVARRCRFPPDGETCEVAIKLEYEDWGCVGKAPGGQLNIAQVSVLFRVECFTL